MKVAEICRQAGICEQTFYRWKSKYGGMGVSEVHRLKAVFEIVSLYLVTAACLLKYEVAFITLREICAAVTNKRR